MFATIAHADWSVAPAKRWVVWAERHGTGWRVGAPEPAANTARLVAALMAARRRGPVLAGFDFPIGLPLAYGLRTGFRGFRAALAAFGTAPGWEDVWQVAAHPGDVSLRRPFFPRTAVKGVRRSALVTGLGLADDAALLRLCERKAGPEQRQACPVFWTLGPNQVGRAAIVGWREVVVPAAGSGAALWPFDGTLQALARPGALVLAETYPADVPARIGAAFGPRASKRRQADRRARAAALLGWADMAGVDIAACRDAIDDGFGSAAVGEDRFDALMGALGMIPVVDGRHPAMPPGLPRSRIAWEGWILGRSRPEIGAAGHAAEGQ